VEADFGRPVSWLISELAKRRLSASYVVAVDA